MNRNPPHNSSRDVNCLTCGVKVPVLNKFCGQCGTPALQKHIDFGLIETSLATGRRSISIVYVDLVSSTNLVRSIDPELYDNIIKRYQQCCAEVVNDFGGKITEVVGDGVIALFSGDEKFTESSIRASDEIVKSIAALRSFETPAGPFKLAVRIGICSGVALIKTDPINHTPRVFGQAPIHAARLQSLAGAEQILLCHDTYLKVNRQFEFRKHPRAILQSKGYENDANDVWRFISLNDAKLTFSSRTSNKLTPLIGRKSLMDSLLSQWASVISKRGQIAYITGVAGIGKSRVLEEFQQRVKRLTPDLIILRYQCSKYAKRSPLYPVVKQIARLSHMKEQDSAQILSLKLNNLLTSWGVNGDTFTPTLLPVFLENKLDDEQHQKQIHLAIRGCTQIPLFFARRSPMMVLIEDFQWVDSASRRLIEDCLNLVSKRQIFFLVTYRPDEANITIPSQPHVQQYQLKGLSKKEASELLDSVKARSTIAKKQRQTIIDKSLGIPLFLEELALNTKLEPQSNTSSTNIRTPLSLFDLLLHRYDNLDPATKAIAQCASVMGQEFELKLIQSILGLQDQQIETYIRRLIENEQIYIIDQHSKEYCFKHALVRDAIYDNTLNQDKFRLHKVTYDFLSTLSQTRSRLMIQRIEHHKNMMQFYAKYAHIH